MDTFDVVKMVNLKPGADEGDWVIRGFRTAPSLHEAMIRTGCNVAVLQDDRHREAWTVWDSNESNEERQTFYSVIKRNDEDDERHGDDPPPFSREEIDRMFGTIVSNTNTGSTA